MSVPWFGEGVVAGASVDERGAVKAAIPVTGDDELVILRSYGLSVPALRPLLRCERAAATPGGGPGAGRAGARPYMSCNTASFIGLYDMPGRSAEPVVVTQA